MSVMTTWEAREIAADPQPFQGRTVAFTSQGFTYTGTLDTVYKTDEWDHLVVDGVDHVVNSYETVAVS